LCLAIGVQQIFVDERREGRREGGREGGRKGELVLRSPLVKIWG
jgi:hypothetical protein